MSMTMYDVLVPSYIQILDGLVGTLDIGLAFCKEKGIDPDEMAQRRLVGPMQPLSFQVFSAAYHSAGAIDSLKEGAFHPPSREPINSYAKLQEIARDALAKVKTLTPQDVNDHMNKEIVFASHGFKLVYTAENFIHTFSLPNFYFHVTMAYALLRQAGAPLSKRNYLGSMRVISSEGF